MRLCVIPARGGSKRIPRKNIKQFYGKPMIGYSIEAAIKFGNFDHVIVSTDDEEIAAISKLYGAEVPFIRPDEISNDHVGTTPVIKHAIEWFEQSNIAITEVCCLYATAPFVRADTINKAYKQWKLSRADYCFTVTSYSFPVQRAVEITEKNRLKMFYPQFFSSRSQDLKEAYHDAGQFYWGKAEAFKTLKPLFSDFSSPYVLPRHLVQDIDTPEDWKRAEFMYKLLLETGEYK